MPLGAHQPLFLTGPLPAPWCPPAPQALPLLSGGWVTWAPLPPAHLRQETESHPLSSLSPQCGATHLTHCTPAGAHNCSLRGCCCQRTRCTGEEVERLGTLPLVTVSSRWLEIFNTETKTPLLTALLPCSTRGGRGQGVGSVHCRLSHTGPHVTGGPALYSRAVVFGVSSSERPKLRQVK